ncbi:MAG TPA: hypothetical protein VGR28_02110 [Candidatus Thermoplasmatota archaeon]|nr:hypothetical protein [Candidatus Thermoplasmatota archaeon]
MRASRVWLIIAAFFFALSAIAALGEWVFHWWAEPGDWLSLLSLVMAVASLGWSASSRDLEAARDEQRRRFDAQDAAHRLQAEGQQKLLEGQQKLLEGQQKLLEGQTEQTRLLQELVASFRPRESA